MSKESVFLVYCIEIVKRSRSLTGKQVYKLFEECNLFKFIIDFYELLHVHGDNYILEDINERISEFSV